MRKRIPVSIVMTLSLLGGIVWWQWWSTPERSTRFIEAQRLISERSFEQAVHLLQQHIERWPNHALGHLSLAQSARRSDSYALANQHLQRYAELDGDPGLIAHERNLMNIQRGLMANFDGGLKLAEKDPDSPESPLILEAMIRGYLRLSQPAKGITIVERWEQFPLSAADRLQADIWRGEFLRMAGQMPAAEQLFRRLVNEHPERHDAKLRLAECLIRSNPAEAKPLLDTLLQHQPDDFVTRLVSAQCARLLGSVEESRAVLNDLHQQQPQNLSVLIELAQLDLDSDRIAEAERHLTAIESIRPDVHEAVALRLRIAQLRGNTEEARKLEIRLEQLKMSIEKSMSIPAPPQGQP